MDTDRTEAVGDSAVSDDASFLRFLVVGVDGSDGSRRALRWAAQLAETTGARSSPSTSSPTPTSCSAT